MLCGASEVGDEPAVDGLVREGVGLVSRCWRSGRRFVDAVDAEQTPVLTLRVVGDEVPDAVAQDLAVRLNDPVARVAVLVGVCEAQMLSNRDGVRDHPQGGPIDRVRGGEDLGGRCGGDGSLTQAGRQESLKLGSHGSCAVVCEACFKDEEPRDKRADLVGVQEKRWDLDARNKNVCPAGARVGLNVVAQHPQPGDITANRPGCHLESAAKVSHGPPTSRLQQGQQA